MQGYDDLDEYEDYEDEGGEYEEEGGEYEEEEEEDPERLQQEKDYLELRQKLKEQIRKKSKKELGTDLRAKKSKLPYDNFGSFFGPSKPVIAQRVIEESKSLLENPHLAERVLKPKSANQGGSSNSAVSRPRPNDNGHSRKVDIRAKHKQAKAEMIKNTRDYSFLLTEDAEIPVAPKNPPKSAPPQRPEVHSSQRRPDNSGRKVINGREERNPAHTSSQMRPKASQQSQRPSNSSKVTSTALDSRKQNGRNDGSGPGRPSGQKPLPSNLDSRKQNGRNDGSSSGRPLGQKPLPSKMQVASKQKVIPPAARNVISSGHKPLSSRSPPVINKKPLESKRDMDHKRDLEHRRDMDRRRDMDHRRDMERRRDMDDRGSVKANMNRKPMVSSKPQIKQHSARPPVSAQQKQRPQKRPARPFDDDDDEGEKAISMIRNMFGYNPNRYRNDDDDSDMEAGFEDIMREEKRSAKIAAMEDEEEAKKIEEEERRERMRKEAKRRKLSQR
ncbi:chromatin SPT2 [Artemisia annua]|uniref:Chromatin SPT2 n=1 Tax=Artemisia annua TaxID=35608 RepID=A0A2U1NKK8_ARTAN|nr:chromatin SPT2 [Artemisia annua]